MQEEDLDEHKEMIQGLPVRCVVMVREGVPGLQRTYAFSGIYMPEAKNLGGFPIMPNGIIRWPFWLKVRLGPFCFSTSSCWCGPLFFSQQLFTSPCFDLV